MSKPDLDEMEKELRSILAECEMRVERPVPILDGSGSGWGSGIGMGSGSGWGSGSSPEEDL